MDDLHYVILALALALLAVLLAWLRSYLRAQRSMGELRQTNTELQTTLELERRNQEEKLAALEQARAELAHTFATLSKVALRDNNEVFLQLAQQNFSQLQLRAEHELKQREQSIENLVNPIKEALDKAERQIHAIEKERRQAYGSLSKHLETVVQAQQQLYTETRNLASALRRPNVRGRWGELTLRRLAELAGMAEHCDFYEQEHQRSAEGDRRPDMIIRLPDQREIVVDAKTPLDAYLDAVEADNDTERQRGLDLHARHLRQRVRDLAAKAYWSQFQRAPDFVILFIPGDQFLAAALERDRSLLEDALANKVVLATPTSFVALLRAIAYGWRQTALNKNAEQVRQVAEQLYHRLATYSEHLARLGRSINASVEHFNKAAGSMERQILPSARKLEDLGVQGKKRVESLEPVDQVTRSLRNE